jgi:hypothetical protein
MLPLTVTAKRTRGRVHVNPFHHSVTAYIQHVKPYHFLVRHATVLFLLGGLSEPQIPDLSYRRLTSPLTGPLTYAYLQCVLKPSIAVVDCGASYGVTL